VAATRARHQLHLLGNLNVKESRGEAQLAQPRNGSLLAQLWPVVQEPFARALEQYRVEVPAVSGDQQPELALRRLHPDWEMPDTPPPVTWKGYEDTAAEQLPAIEYEWAGLTIRHIGTLVHRCIRSIAGLGIDQWGADRIRACSNRFRQSLRELGVPVFELDDACRRVETALLNFIKDERGQWLLADHELQKNEFAVSGILGGRVVNIIVDRTFVDQDGIRWIVDYKTSSHEGTDIEGFLDLQQERYRQQLEKYGALFSKLEERPIRLGLYFPLLGGWREWEYK
jgi:ATP-dependent exoDNAse (exonuclease V) beta subunit